MFFVAKAPEKKYVYGVGEAPTTTTGLNEDYMYDYVKDKLENGEITAEQVQEFIDKTDNEEMKSAEKRKVFANIFMPELIKKRPLNERLADLIKGR